MFSRELKWFLVNIMSATDGATALRLYPLETVTHSMYTVVNYRTG